MPRPPPAAYDASRAHITTQRSIADQASQPDVAPPVYSSDDSPIVRRL